MEPPTETPPEELPSDHPAEAPSCRFNPWLFFGFLVAPAILALFLMLGMRDSNDYGMGALLVISIGSVIAGLVCGIHFARTQTRLSVGMRWAVGVVSVIGCAGVAFALGFGGCFLVMG